MNENKTIRPYLHNKSTNNGVSGKKKPRSKVGNKLVIFLFWRNVISAMTILQKNNFSHMQKGEKIINTIQRSVKIENIS